MMTESTESEHMYNLFQLKIKKAYSTNHEKLEK